MSGQRRVEVVIGRPGVRRPEAQIDGPALSLVVPKSSHLVGAERPDIVSDAIRTHLHRAISQRLNRRRLPPQAPSPSRATCPPCCRMGMTVGRYPARARVRKRGAAPVPQYPAASLWWPGGGWDRGLGQAGARPDEGTTER